MSDNVRDGAGTSRRERYERVLRVVDYNTFTAADSPAGWRDNGVPPVTVVSTLARDGHDPRRVRATIRAAVDNADLVQWTDREGATRLTPHTRDGLQAVARSAAERAEPDRELVAAANRAIQRADPDPAAVADGGRQQ